jgi:signal transduction histidine kinase
MSVVTVADNGPGVPEEIRENLFEPFATTKSVGMGLGLAISRAILSAHGGLIWCDSGSTGGAVFSFSLPSSEGRKIWNS